MGAGDGQTKGQWQIGHFACETPDLPSQSCLPLSSLTTIHPGAQAPCKFSLNFPRALSNPHPHLSLTFHFCLRHLPHPHPSLYPLSRGWLLQYPPWSSCSHLGPLICPPHRSWGDLCKCKIMRHQSTNNKSKNGSVGLHHNKRHLAIE